MKTNYCGSPTFRFGRHIRKYIMSLGDLLYYANSRDDGRWASQSSDPKFNGVYGHVYDAVKAILKEELGEEIALAAMERINYGGDSSFGLDIENAVQEAKEMLAETYGRP